MYVFSLNNSGSWQEGCVREYVLSPVVACSGDGGFQRHKRESYRNYPGISTPALSKSLQGKCACGSTLELTGVVLTRLL